MTEQTHPALLPCPHCRGACDAEPWRDGKGWRGPSCVDCGASTPTVDAWNRRAALSPAQPVSDERIREIDVGDGQTLRREKHVWLLYQGDIVYCALTAREAFWIDSAIRQALAISSPVAQAEPEVEQKDEALPFVVQYRRKQCGDTWRHMAAFDQKLVARRYAENCGKDNPHWEYRAVRRKPAPPSHAQGVAAGVEMAAKVCEDAADQSEQTFGQLSNMLEQAACKGAVAQARKLQHSIRALQPQDAVCVTEPTLICPLCEADRYKEPCRGRDILKCPMAGTAAQKGE
jgi:hypothetical protein